MIDAVHQVLPVYAPRDAVGTHTRHARRVLRSMGLRSDVYAEGHAGAPRREVRDIGALARDLDRGGRTLLVYQLSTGSKVGELVLARPEPKVVNYHNVTAVELFAPWEPIVGAELRYGREQLARFAPASELGIAVSGFNEGELVAAGFKHTAVAPVMFDVADMERAVDERALAELQAAKRHGGADLLFVGRVAPNKCQHDLVKVLAAYRRMFDPQARLHIVGGMSSHAYWTALHEFARAVGLADAVHITGSVPPGVLAAHFRSADVFVCVSEHEGFCVPVLEAMHHGLPVVAYGAAAIPETVADAGIVLPTKQPAVVAAAVARVVADEPLRQALVAAGHRRIEELSLERAEAAFRTAMESVLDRL